MGSGCPPRPPGGPTTSETKTNTRPPGGQTTGPTNPKGKQKEVETLRSTDRDPNHLVKNGSSVTNPKQTSSRKSLWICTTFLFFKNKSLWICNRSRINSIITIIIKTGLE